MNAASLDAITIDAYGTLLTVINPVSSLQRMLPAHDRESIESAFRVEAAFYEQHSSDGRTTQELTRLHERSVAVFNDALGSSLSASDYAGVFEFELLPGVTDALDSLRARGLSLAVVGNWDISLPARLETAGIAEYFPVVIPAARKPAPGGILEALRILRVDASRALHIGDSASDEQAARAAGVAFLPAPVPEAVAALT